MPLLSVRDLEVQIPVSAGIVHPVNAVSFEIGRGEIVGIIGETGSGKSTVARALIGLLSGRGRVTGGSIELDVEGRTIDLRRQDEASMRRIRGGVVGFVPQSTSAALNPVVRLDRQFAAVLRSHESLSRKACRTRALEMLELVKIRDPERVLGGYAFELSGGMAQRVAIALTLALDPTLVIADEPTTGLDVTVQKQILDQLRELSLGRGRSMLLITHDMGVVAQYCHRVIVLYGGYVLETGRVADVLERPTHPYTRLLLDAIPEQGKRLRVIRGAVGDLLTLPEGCPFYERCPVQSARCATEMPPLIEVGAGHRVATFCAPEVTGAAA